MTADRVRVGDVLTLQRRVVDVQPDGEYEEIGVRSFGRGIFHKELVSGASLGNKRVFQIEPGDIVISNVFAWEGAVALASVSEKGKIGSHRFMTFTPASDAIDPSWVAWFFRSEPGLDLIRKASPGSAGRNRTLAIDRFEALEIPLPPIDRQREVVAQLGHLQNAADALRRLATWGSQVRDALGVSVCARPDLGEKARLAAGWRKVALGEVMAPAREPVVVDASSTYPNVGVYSFGRGLFTKPEIDGAATSAKTLNRIRAGQFIYSRLFAFEGAYATVEAHFDGAFVSNEFPTFDPAPERLDATWLAAVFRSPDRWIELSGSSKGLGVRRQRIPVEALLAHEVWLPPIDEQRGMTDATEQLAIAAARRASADARIDAILPAALNEVFANLN